MVFPDDVCQGGQIQFFLLRYHDDRCAHGQGRVHISQGAVKAIAVVAGDPGFLRGGEEAAVPGRISGEIPVQKLYALRDTGGAGGVDQQEQILRIDGCRFCPVGGLRPGQGCQLRDAKAAARKVLEMFQARHKAVIHKDEFCIRILCHKRQAFIGIIGIQGLIGAAGLQHAKGGNDHVFRAPDKDCHGVSAPQSLLRKVMGNAIRKVIHFCVGIGALLVNHCDIVRAFGCLLSEELHNGRFAVVVMGGIVEFVQPFQCFCGDNTDLRQGCRTGKAQENLPPGKHEFTDEVLGILGSIVRNGQVLP